MKCKKVVSMAMAGVMTLAMAVPSMAADPLQTVITGKYEEITLDVVVMPTGSATINPYEMPVPVMDTNTSPAKIAGKTLNTAGKIASQPLAMYNKTNVALNVGATVTAANISEGLELVTKNIGTKATEKQVQVYLEAKQETTLASGDVGKSKAAGVIGDFDGGKLADIFNTWEASTYNAANTNQVLVNPEAAATKKGLAIMNAGKEEGGKMVPDTGSFVLYRLGGNCVESPETAWTGTDKFDVNVVFSFTPVKYTEVTGAAAGTISASPASIDVGGTASSTITVTAPSGTTFSANATYEWTVTPGATAVSIDSGTGTASIVVSGDGTGTPGTATVSVVVTDGTTIYKPADVTLTVTA